MEPFKKGPSEKAENRIADALEYIAKAIGIQTQVMMDQAGWKVKKEK